MIRRIAIGLAAAFCLITFLPIEGCAVIYGSSTWQVSSSSDLSPSTEDYESKGPNPPYRFRGRTSAVLDLSGTGLSERIADDLASSLRNAASHTRTETFSVADATYRPENGWLPDILMLSKIRSASGSMHVVRSEDDLELSLAMGRTPVRFEGYRKDPWRDARAEWKFTIHRTFKGLQSPAGRTKQLTWHAGRQWRKSALKVEWAEVPQPTVKPPTTLEDPSFPIEGSFDARAIYTGRRTSERQETLWLVNSQLGFYDARDALVEASGRSQWTQNDSRKSSGGRFVAGAFERDVDGQTEWLHIASFWDESTVREEDAGPEPIAVLYASPAR